MPTTSHRTSRNKKIFTLPVTPFVKKILTTRYGSPVDVNQTYHREICTLLQLQPIINVEKKKKMLTTSVEFLTPYNLANAVFHADQYAIGVSLHSHYLYKMYEFIYMHIEIANSMTAYKALQLFFDKFGITDEDLDFDSAYRGWVRYKKNQEPAFKVLEILTDKKRVSTKILFDVHKELTQFKALYDGRKIRLSQFNKLVREEINLKKYPLQCIDKVQYFFLRHLCLLSYQQIADRAGRSKGSIRHHLRTAISFIEKSPEAIALFRRILEELKKNILPVLPRATG